MNEPRCGSCRHWKPAPSPFDGQACSLVSDTSGLARIDIDSCFSSPEAVLLTDAGFGCVLFDPKGADPEG